MSIGVEIVLVWCAVTAYAMSSVILIAGVVFGRERMLAWGLWTAVAGLVPQVVAFAGRWVRVGHAPFLGFYEVVSSYAFVSVAVFAALAIARPRLRAVGIALMPLSFLAIGGSMFADKADQALSGKLASWWLTVHVTFAKLSYSSFIVAFALAVVFLLRDRRERIGDTRRSVLDNLPSQSVIDDLSFRFIGVGTIFLGIMIAAGAIWANEAWGRYWGWDAIETWSLVSWLVYSAYLHFRLTLGWRGRKAAWFALAALPMLAFSFVGVPVVYDSIHGAYIQGL